MTNLLLQALKQKLRFNTTKGALSVEQIMDLPMTSKTGLSLLAIAEPLAEAVKKKPKKLLSFFDEEDISVDKSDDMMRLEIIEAIVEMKKADNKAKSVAASNSARIATLKAIRDQKLAQQDSEMSLEEIEAELVKLGN